MELYHQIISNISELHLESFELESLSRKYVGYTLFQRHYFYAISEPEPMDNIYLSLESINIDDEDNFEYNSSSESIATNHSGLLSSGTDISSNEQQSFPKIYDIWNSLDPKQQYFWSQRALMLNKMPLLGEFTDIPDTLINNNMLSKEKL